MFLWLGPRLCGAFVPEASNSSPAQVLSPSSSDQVCVLRLTKLWSAVAVPAPWVWGRGPFCHLLVKAQYLSASQCCELSKNLTVKSLFPLCPLLLSLAGIAPNNALEALVLVDYVPIPTRRRSPNLDATGSLEGH